MKKKLLTVFLAVVMCFGVFGLTACGAGSNPDDSYNYYSSKYGIEEEIKTMPNYFADYDTTVHFISEEELARDHSGIPHGGFVIRSGMTGSGNTHIIEYSLKLDSNPEFTASVLVACARAAVRMSAEGIKGAKTVFDIAPCYLSMKSNEELRKEML